MAVYKYFPVANDRMGIIWTLSSIKDVCIIEFGPAGTTHYAIEGIGSLNGEDEAKIYSTHMDESDVTFGKYERLEKAIVEVDENINPKYIFVMASSISSIIGADIKSVCMMLEEQVNAKLIPITTGGLKYDYHVGVRNALELLVKNMVCENEKDINKYNIIGSNIDKYNFSSDCEEITRIMRDLFNKYVNTIFTSKTSVEEIENAAKASLNIVLRKEGLKAAKYMEKKFNIPYIYANVYGLNNIVEFVREIDKIDGYTLNEDRLNKEVEEVKKHMFSVKRKFFFYKGTKDCAVFGDLDTVVGISSIIEELGLKVVRKEVLYSETDENVLSNLGELDRMKYLKNTELFGLFADGASIDMNHSCKLDVQVSNPNLNKINIYKYTPYVGFRGMVNIIEKLLNVKIEASM